MSLHITASGEDALGFDDWVITGCGGLPEISRVEREIEVQQSSEVGLVVARKAEEIGDMDGLLWHAAAARRYAEKIESGMEPNWDHFVEILSKFALTVEWSEFLLWLKELHDEHAASWTMPSDHVYFFRRVQSIYQVGDDSIRQGVVQAWVVATTGEGTVRTPIGSQAADVDWTRLIAALRNIL